MADDGAGKPDRPWTVDETTHQPRGGVGLIVFGLLFTLWGGWNVAENGAPLAFLMALLGIGLLVAGATIRSVRSSQIRQQKPPTET